MKKIISMAFTLFSLSANSAYLSSISISPETPITSNDTVATIYGDLADSGSYIINTVVTQEDNSITLDIFTTSLGGFQVLTPFNHTENLGGLSSGNYTFTANGYIDGNLSSSINTSFSVSEVPLPASAWFFLTSIGVLVGKKKLNKSSKRDAVTGAPS